MDSRRFLGLALPLLAIVAGCIGGPSTAPSAPATPDATAASTSATTSQSPTTGGSHAVDAPPTGLIAFLGGNEDESDAFVVNSDGTGLRQLTEDAGGGVSVGGLRWLLDGSRLVFTWSHYQDPYHERVVSIRPDGTDRRELGTVQTIYHDPELSPDGRRVAFSGDGAPGGETGIFLLDLATGELTQLTTDGATNARWSPDATQILAVLPGRRILVLDATTGERVTVIEDEHVQATVGWTADGTSILYHSCPPKLTKPECMAESLVIAAVDGTDVRPYDGPVATQIEGVVSPDGAWIAGSRDFVVYVRRSIAGSPEIALGAGGQPAWSPDSGWLVFPQRAAGVAPSGQSAVLRLVVARRAGGQLVPITEGPYDHAPAWQP